MTTNNEDLTIQKALFNIFVMPFVIVFFYPWVFFNDLFIERHRSGRLAGKSEKQLIWNHVVMVGKIVLVIAAVVFALGYFSQQERSTAGDTGGESCLPFGDCY